MKKKSQFKLPKYLTTVTPFSRILALSLFIIVPIISFYLGIYYQKTTHRGFGNFFCKHWLAVCNPNYADKNSYCAVQQVCEDSSLTPTPTPLITNH